MARFNLDIATPPENRTICSVPANDWARFVEPVTDLLPGDVLAQAAFTVKRSPSDADTAGTSVQRIITAVAGTPGFIDQTKNILTFDFRPQDTALMLDSHFFDVQVWVARGADTFIKTIIKGRITSVVDITNQTLLVGTGTTIDIVGDVPVTGDPGDFFQLVAEVRDVANNIIPGVAVTWDSSNPLIASVDAAGLVTIWNVGTCTITASAAAYSLSAIENVTSTDPSFIAATEGEVPVYRTGVWTPQLLTTLGTVTIGTWAATTIGPTHGGTGFGAFAVGDTLYADTTTSLAKRAIGSGGQFSVVSGGIPVWHTLVSADVTDATSANTPSMLIKRDGSGNFAAGTMTGSITGAAPAGSLSGTTLNATVVSSSLTSVGALASGSIVAGFGSITATAGAFSSSLGITAATGQIAVVSSTGTNAAYIDFTTTGGTYYFGVENSAGGIFGATAYAAIVYTPGGRNIELRAGGVLGIKVDGTTATSSFGGNAIAATDASFDIGASGANRFRDLFLSRSATLGGTLTVGGGSFAPARLYVDANLGLVVAGKTGAIYDLALTNNSGGQYMNGVTGTQNVVFFGALSGITTLTGTGAVSGFTTANFSNTVTAPNFTGTGTVILSGSTQTTGAQYIQIVNTGVNAVFGVENSTGGNIFTGTSAYAIVIGSATASRAINLVTNNTVQVAIASTGAVTFAGAVSGIAALAIGGAFSGATTISASSTITQQLDASLIRAVNTAGNTQQVAIGSVLGLTGAGSTSTGGMATNGDMTFYPAGGTTARLTLNATTAVFGSVGLSGITTLAGTGAISGFTSATLNGALLAGTDNSFDIGASGANRFRDFFLSRNMNIGGTSTLTQAVVIGNHAASTLGDLSVDGATTSSFGPVIRLMRGGVAKGYVGTESAINGGSSDDIIAYSLNGFSIYAGNTASNFVKVLSTGAVSQAATAISSFATNVTGTAGYIFSNANATNGSIFTLTSTSAAGTGWYLIEGNNNGGTTCFFVLGNGNVQNTNNSYGAISDARFKTVLGDAGSQLDDFRAYRFRKYQIHSAPSAKGLVAFAEPSAVQMGLVAQEVREVSPGLVDEDSNGFLSLKYSVLAIKNAKATQELIALIDRLEARVQTLERQPKP